MVNLTIVSVACMRKRDIFLFVKSGDCLVIVARLCGYVVQRLT